MLDATVGQTGVAQAREFMNAAGVNGIVLTKLDGTAKGGVAVAIANDLKLPIRYVGVGEGIEIRGAWLDNGLLHIDLVRPTVEARVRTIEIRDAGGAATAEPGTEGSTATTRLRPGMREKSAG